MENKQKVTVGVCYSQGYGRESGKGGEGQEEYIVILRSLHWLKINEHIECLLATADDALFKRMLANQHYVLQPLLPDQSSHNYNLRNRRQLQLTQKTTQFNNKLFIIRLLFKDTY